MIKLEEQVFLLGKWSSIDQLEEELTMTELHRLFMAKQEQDYNDRVFRASLEGIKMDPWKDPDEDVPELKASSFDEIRERAAKRAAVANGDISADSALAKEKSSPFDGFGFDAGEDE